MFKRIALATVSALGFGLLGAVTTPASANSTLTASFSVPVTSVTVVTPASGVYDSSTAFGAVFKITLRGNATTKDAAWGLTNTETLTASVVGVPAGTGTTAKAIGSNFNDLVLIQQAPVNETSLAGNPYQATARGTWFTPTETSADVATNIINWGGADNEYWETGTSQYDNSYYFTVVPGAGKTVVDQGEYTIRLRLTSNDGALLVQDTLVRVRFVSSPIGAGFTLTATDVGNYSVREAALAAYNADKYISATLRDANGGRVIVESSAGTHSRPSLLADVVNKLGAVISTGATLTASDTGDTLDFGITSSSTTQAQEDATGNGVYGITTSANWLDTATTNAAGGADSVRVRYADKVATAPLTILSGLTSATGTLSVSATGLSVLSTANASTLPLTTKSAKVTVGNATAGNDVVFTVTWTGTASGDQTPADSEKTVVVASSAGIAELTVTNNNPVNGATATVSVDGFSTDPTDHVITWRASTAATMSVSLNGAIVALKSKNTFTATVLDHFGAPVSGVVLTPSVTGTTSANYSATATYASVATNAQGQATFDLTDAKAVADGTDTVTFTHVAASPITAASSTITYAATAPAPTTLSTFWARTGIAASADSVSEVSTPVPSTGIYASGTTAFQVTIDRNTTRAITRSATGDHFTVRVRALKGAAVTATAPVGAYVLNSSDFAVSSRTLYGDANGDVYFTLGSTKTGANTVTFTSGTATTTVSFWVATANTKARFVTLTGPATGTANGELQNYEVTVTDRYGNPVSNVALSISATGAAAFGGGNTLQTFTTGESGKFTFTGTSFAAAGGAGSFTASFTGAGTDATSAAGFVDTTAVDSTLAAGNSSATLAVTFAAGQSAAAQAAEAATDAALEAIDAANAATDAANLAAEAADAATVAAEEARDAADAATAAVEALASEVATLIAGLKAQITTLANTVAKIAKKVKA